MLPGHTRQADVSTVSLVVTSCGRRDLLWTTLETFARCNTYPLNQLVVVEDGGLELDVAELADVVGVAPDQVLFLKNEQNIGQIASIDRAYAAVNSEYIFHCEDDWEFFRPGFIEASLDILESDPEVICVWLRAHNDTNGQPIETKVLTTHGERSYHRIESGYKGVWSGFTLNPGLRRTRDSLRLHPYATQPMVDDLGRRERVTESDLSILFGRLGYCGAITADKQGYVRHIGYGHHLASEWELKGLVWCKNLLRRMLLKVRQ